MLKLAKDAPPHLREALARRFHAEQEVLGAYWHPRIVRLLGYGVDEALGAGRPYALAF